MTLVVYEGLSGRRNALRTQRAYRIGKHRLVVGEPIDLPDDVAQQLLGGVRGHRFSQPQDGGDQGGGDQAQAASTDDTQPDTGGASVEGSADADTAPPADEPVTATTTTRRGR